MFAMQVPLHVIIHVLLPALAASTGITQAHRSWQVSCDDATVCHPMDSCIPLSRPPALLLGPATYQNLIQPTLAASLDAQMEYRPPPTSTHPAIKEQAPLAALCGPGCCASTQHANQLMFAMQVPLHVIIHVLLPALAASTGITQAHRSWQVSCDDATVCHPMDSCIPLSRPPALLLGPATYQNLIQPTLAASLDAQMEYRPPPTSTHPAIKEQAPLAALCGPGCCASTQHANQLMFAMQVSNAHSLFTKRSSNYFLLQLPGPHCCLSIVVQCCDVIRSLLLLAGDIETNPGPDNQAVLNELKKLTAGQSQLITEIKGLKTQMQTTDKAIADLSLRMTNLETHYENLALLRSDIENMKGDAACAAQTIQRIEMRIDDAENHSRRNNLLFYGISESSGSESFALSEKIIIDHCNKYLIITLDAKEIERAHRLGNRTAGNNRPIIVKFTFNKTKELVLSNGRKFKGTGFSVGEDFTRNIQIARRHLIAFAKSKSAPYSLRFKTLFMGNKRYVYDDRTKSVKELQ
uniref:Tick transposon n=1 Tax=Rhipicephalus pulchellus TaxID=72859 RepID=L7LY12_RHIPC